METSVHTREEDDELQRSTKKVKFPTLNPYSDGIGTRGLSYKESLLGEILGAFEQAFVVDSPMDFEALSDDEFENLPPGEVAVKLSGDRENKIRASWANALIMKVFRKTIGFHFLQSRLTNMWKPSAECCLYSVKQLDKIVSSEFGVKRLACQSSVEELDPEEKAFGPWVLVARKGKPSRQMIKEVRLEANFGSPFQSPIKPFNSLSSQTEPFPANGTSLNNKASSSAIAVD
nr:hypothetical protein CFP56_72895 [Quercus suber]